MNKLQILTEDVIIDIGENHGWTVRFNMQKIPSADCEEIKEKYVEFYQESPAGQDFGFTVYYEELEDIAEKVFFYWQDYDIEEEVRMFLEAKQNGFAGVPDVVTLVKDQQEIENMIEELWEALRDWKNFDPQEVDGLMEFKIPLIWKMYGTIYVTAKTVDEAIKYALSPECLLPEGTYLDDSAEVDPAIEITATSIKKED